MPRPRAARRNSRLDCRRLAEHFGVAFPHWKTALEQTLNGIARGQKAEKPPTVNCLGWHPSSTDAKGVGAPRHLQRVDVLGVPSAADLDVGVIYTHERDWMSRLLPTLARSGDDLRLRLILVDNVSADGTARWESHVAQTTVLRNTHRVGYAPNLNRILEASTAPLVLLLNTDMEFDPAEQCLSKMVRFMREHPCCGLAGCRLYHPDGTYGYPARRFQTLGVIAGRRTPLAPLFRQAVDRYRYEDQSHTKAFECDWLSGCFLLVRRGLRTGRSTGLSLHEILRRRGPVPPHGPGRLARDVQWGDLLLSRRGASQPQGVLPRRDAAPAVVLPLDQEMGLAAARHADPTRKQAHTSPTRKRGGGGKHRTSNVQRPTSNVESR